MPGWAILMNFLRRQAYSIAARAWVRPWLNWVFALSLDTRNKLLYGPSAPLYAERIWINPKQIEQVITGIDSYSGRVVSAWPPKNARKAKALRSTTQVASCVSHWLHGVPWKETAGYQRQLKLLENNGICWDADCFSEHDVADKYRALDEIYGEARRMVRLKTREELDVAAFREHGTFLVHGGPRGKCYLGGHGYHRFSIALVLGLPLVPAQLGCVYKKAIPYLKHLRHNSAPQSELPQSPP